MIRALLLLGIIYFTSGNIYYVTFVKGNVRLLGTNKILALGDAVTDSDKIIFPDKNARITCISPTRGRFDLSPDKSKQGNTKEWVGIIKNILVQSSTLKQLSTRELPTENTDPGILFKSYSPENKVLLVDHYPIKTSNNFKLDRDQFLFLKYVVSGKTILKKLPVNGQFYFFDSSLFTNSYEELISPELVGTVSLCFQQLKNGSAVSEVIIKFLPVLISMQEFKNECFILRQNLELPGIKKEQADNEIYNHFCTNYGFLYPGIFKKLAE